MRKNKPVDEIYMAMIEMQQEPYETFVQYAARVAESLATADEDFDMSRYQGFMQGVRFVLMAYEANGLKLPTAK